MGISFSCLFLYGAWACFSAFSLCSFLLGVVLFVARLLVSILLVLLVVLVPPIAFVFCDEDPDLFPLPMVSSSLFVRSVLVQFLIPLQLIRWALRWSGGPVQFLFLSLLCLL